MSLPINPYDKMRLRAIYHSVAVLTPSQKDTHELSSLLEFCLAIASKYGNTRENTLLILLQKTKKQHAAACKPGIQRRYQIALFRAVQRQFIEDLAAHIFD